MLTLTNVVTVNCFGIFQHIGKSHKRLYILFRVKSYFIFRFSEQASPINLTVLLRNDALSSGYNVLCKIEESLIAQEFNFAFVCSLAASVRSWKSVFF